MSGAARAHDWRWGMIDGGNGPGRRVPIAVCWRCDAVAWNEVDFAAIDVETCPEETDHQRLNRLEPYAAGQQEVLDRIRSLLAQPPRTVHDGDDLLDLIREVIR